METDRQTDRQTDGDSFNGHTDTLLKPLEGLRGLQNALTVWHTRIHTHTFLHSTHICGQAHTRYLSVYLSVCLCLCLSVYLSICLSVYLSDSV